MRIQTHKNSAVYASLYAAALVLGNAPTQVFAADTKTTASTICAACHGPDGNGIAASFPKLASQSAEYLVKQMTEFITGKRKNEVMAPFIANLKASNLNELGTYFAGLAPSPGKVEKPELITAGKDLYLNGNLANGVPGCVGCHGPNGAGVALNARLAGQYQSYTVAQLVAFKNGTRNNDKARVMRNAVQNLSAAEMEAVAEYLTAQ
jgi:cytochrome c553